MSNNTRQTCFPSPDSRESTVTLIGEAAIFDAKVWAIGAVAFFAFTGPIIWWLVRDIMRFGVRLEELAGLIFITLFLLAFLSGGVFCSIAAISRFRESRRVAPPSITISASPLFLGETFHGEVIQRLKEPVDVKSVAVSLICREQVERTVGSTTQIGEHRLLTKRKQLPISGMITPPDCIRGSVEFHIPEDAMHSFFGYKNQIDWMINVKIKIVDQPDVVTNIELSVAPRKLSGQDV